MMQQTDRGALDINVLAKAAVGGDERALDLLSWKKPQGVSFTGYSLQEPTCFALGCDDGRVMMTNDSGELSNLAVCEGSVVRLLFHEGRCILVTATDSGILTLLHILSDGTAKETLKVKLAGRCKDPCIVWAGESVLAMALGEPLIRMWDIMREDNYTLRVTDTMGYSPAGTIQTIAYSYKKNVLAAATSVGQIAFWQFNPLNVMAGPSNEGNISEPEDAWHLQVPTDLRSVDPAPRSSTAGASMTPPTPLLHWGTDTALLAVCVGGRRAYVLHQHTLGSHYGMGVALVQTGPRSLCLADFSRTNFQELNFDSQIHHLCTTQEHFLISNGGQIVIYDFGSEKKSLTQPLSIFNCVSSFTLMHEQSVFTVDPYKIQVRNLQGTVKQLVSLTEAEGSVVSMNICANFLVCATDKLCIKVFDLSRRDAKPIGHSRFLNDLLPHLLRIMSIAVNRLGSCVSVVVEQRQSGGESSSNFDPRLYIWDFEADTLQYFNFYTGLGEQDETETGGSEGSELSSVQQAKGKTEPREGKRTGSAAPLATGQGDTRSPRGDIKASAATNRMPPRQKQVDEEGWTAEDRGRNEAARDVAGRRPVRHFWDTLDPRLVVVEAHRVQSIGGLQQQVAPVRRISRGEEKAGGKKRSIREGEEAECVIVSLFATQEHGIVMQDSFPLHADHSHLLGVDVPYYYFAVRTDVAQRPIQSQSSEGQVGQSTRFVSRRVMRDFVGLEESDRASREAMLNFSFFLTVGNMDEAFKAMKLIKSESVWKNMARMCVKTRRLDVASVCLGKMGCPRAAMLVREARAREPEVDAQVGVLALQLGMTEEANRLFHKANRWDLVNQLYQSMGQWDRAIEVAELHDRIHLRTTYYNYAKFLESLGDRESAATNFVKSETYRFEIPRMLFDTPKELEKFIKERPEKALRKWWAQYMESIEEMQTALQFYESAQDYLSLVRVYCYLGRVDKASDVCNDTGDRAACYHLARQFDTAGDVDKAIHFFSRAHAYSSAVRLCKEHDRKDHLVNLALLGKPEDMVEAASYLQTQAGYEDKAVMLFNKAGQVSRAVDLAFRSRQFGALQHISTDLNDRTDPGLLQRCADFFMANNQFDRAVDLLAAGKQYWEALKLCVEYNVPMTEELAEKLTPPRPDTSSSGTRVGSGGGPSDSERTRLLEGIAEVCLNQRQYHLACKKFTQAGNRQLAMKALLKSGDTEKIVFFANVSKEREVYVMAGNYLQTVDWQQDPELMKNIILFYTKGRAMDSLASFYEACAQIEVEEYHNYEKATGALAEAYKCLSKAKLPNETLQERKLNELKNKILITKKFADVISMLETNSEQAIRECQSLLEDPNISVAIRPGDIYAAMIRHFVAKEKFKAAYSCLEELKRKLPRSTPLTAHLNVATLQLIHRALNIPFSAPAAAPFNGAPTATGKGVQGRNYGHDDAAGGPEVDEEEMAEAIDEDY